MLTIGRIPDTQDRATHGGIKGVRCGILESGTQTLEL